MSSAGSGCEGLEKDKVKLILEGPGRSLDFVGNGRHGRYQDPLAAGRKQHLKEVSLARKIAF